MIQYKDYLKGFMQYYDGLSEEKFIEIAKLFPNLEVIDWDEYYFNNEDLVEYILRQLLYNSVDSYENADLVDYSKFDRSIYLSYAESLQELEKIRECLDKNGWIIENLEDLKIEIEEREKERNTKENLIQKLKDKASIEQLQKFIKEL